MILPPNLAFIAWAPVSLYCFWRYRVQTAILINFIAGWALLPSANYVPDTAAFPYWILGLSLPSSYFFTKASVLGMYWSFGCPARRPAGLQSIQADILGPPDALLVHCSLLVGGR